MKSTIITIRSLENEEKARQQALVGAFNNSTVQLYGMQSDWLLYNKHYNNNKEYCRQKVYVAFLFHFGKLASFEWSN